MENSHNQDKETSLMSKTISTRKVLIPPISRKSLKTNNKENELTNVSSTKSSIDFIPSTKQSLSKRSFGQNITNIIKQNPQMKRELKLNYSKGQFPNSFLQEDKGKLSSLKFSLKESNSLSRLKKDNSHKQLKDIAGPLSSSSTKQYEANLAISKEKLKKQLSNLSQKLLEKSQSFGNINDYNKSNNSNNDVIMNSISDKIPLIPIMNYNMNSYKNFDRKNSIPLFYKKGSNSQTKTKTEITVKNKENIVSKPNCLSANSNPQLVNEYRGEIYPNLLIEEKSKMHLIDPQYMLKQKNEIDSNMRTILIDWLIEIHYKFNYSNESLFLSVSIIDRYLSLKTTTRSKFQLVGVAALFIACKHEEIDLPDPKEFVYITDKAFTAKELFNMEYKILEAIDFAVLLPTSYRLYQYLAVEFNLKPQQDSFGHYLITKALLSYTILKYSYSEIACSCIYLTMKFFELDGYDKCFDKSYCNMTESKGGKSGCIDEICSLFDTISSSEFTASKKKFRHEKYNRVFYLLESKTLIK